MPRLLVVGMWVAMCSRVWSKMAIPPDNEGSSLIAYLSGHPCISVADTGGEPDCSPRTSPDCSIEKKSNRFLFESRKIPTAGAPLSSATSSVNPTWHSQSLISSSSISFLLLIVFCPLHPTPPPFAKLDYPRNYNLTRLDNLEILDVVRHARLCCTFTRWCDKVSPGAAN